MTQKKPQERYDVGMAGAGAMGRNLVLNIADNGFSVAGYDKDQTKKVLDTGHKKRGEIPPGARMTPAKMVSAVRAATVGQKYDAVSIGYHRPVVHGRPIIDPRHLGSGWLGFDFNKAFGRPVKIVNDAAMQRADKNIDELLEDLNGTFHRLRQSGIDEELFDVISGFEALSLEEK